MKKLLVLSAAIFLGLLPACNSDGGGQGTSDKIMLQFKPEKGKTLHINYWFSVNNTSSDDVSTFDMQISGSGETAGNGKVTLDMTNDQIRMTGRISGQEVNGSAEGPDTVSGDAKLVALPVFTLIHKSYRSFYNSQMEKSAEVRMEGNEIADSTENKMQFLLQYPPNEVAVGDSWNKEIILKAQNNMNCSVKYTLKAVHGDTATIVMDGKLSGKGDKFGNEYTMEGKINGEFEVDVKTGWPVDSETHQEFVLKMGGKDIPMIYDIKCKVTK